MKTKPNESVLQDWVCTLPFMQQALLMLATRGPDGLPKYTPAKQILHYLRGVVIKPAHESFKQCDGFMNVDYGQVQYHTKTDGIEDPDFTRPIAGREFGWAFRDAQARFFNDVDIYPMHFYMHLTHAAEVIGYKHPILEIRACWRDFYFNCCDGLHLNPEHEYALDKRLKY